jgi:hypothetical protein
MWPNMAADGNENTKTPGLISDMIENDIVNTSESTTNVAFPILDELDRLAKVSGHQSAKIKSTKNNMN